MGNKGRKPVDLSDGFYDSFEYQFSQFLGVKVLMVRDWDEPLTCSYTRIGDREIFGSKDKRRQELTRERLEWLRARAEYEQNGGPHPGPDPLTEARMETLRDYIADRDPDLEARMLDDELKALAVLGHVVVREGAAAPIEAIIVIDSQQRIQTQKLLVAQIFGGTYLNAWADVKNEKIKTLPVIDVIENFDIATDDYRALRALHDVKFALRRQFDFEALTHGGREDAQRPYYYRLMGQPPHSGGLFAAHQIRTKVEFDEAVARQDLFIPLTHRDMPIEDRDIFRKMTRAGAVADLLAPERAPTLTFARLHNMYAGGPFAGLTHGDIEKCADTLHQAIRNEINVHAAYAPQEILREAHRDLRVLLPVFKRVAAGLDLGPAGEIYMRTIMEGARAYFPTLLNAPVPVMLPTDEPARGTMKIQIPPKNHGPQP